MFPPHLWKLTNQKRSELHFTVYFHNNLTELELFIMLNKMLSKCQGVLVVCSAIFLLQLFCHQTTLGIIAVDYVKLHFTKYILLLQEWKLLVATWLWVFCCLLGIESRLLAHSVSFLLNISLLLKGFVISVAVIFYVVNKKTHLHRTASQSGLKIPIITTHSSFFFYFLLNSASIPWTT